MKQEIRNKVKEFIDEDDKLDLYDECCDSIERMSSFGIPLDLAAQIVRGVVRATRTTYGD